MKSGPLPGILASPLANPAAEVRGPHAFTVRDFAVPGAREVPVRAYLPAGAALPTVIFSPGLAATRAAYGFLAECWASHGYAVLVLEHPGTDGALLKVLGGFRRLLKASEDPEQWAARAGDVRAVLDALPPECDPQRVGVGGHSFGAFTALCIAGGHSAALSDPRPRAFALLSPPGYGLRGIQAGSWAALNRPLLAMTGTQDLSVSDRPWTWRTEPFLDAPANGDKWLLVFEDLRHQDLAGGTVKEPASRELRVALEEATLAFWDVTLRDDARAASLLSPHALGVRVHVDRR